MERKPLNRMTDEELDAVVDEMLEKARQAPVLPKILEASYHPEAGMEFLKLRLDDGRRLFIPREELGELDTATSEQAVDLRIGPNGLDIYWPQIDDGLYLPDFLQYRWRSRPESEAA